MLISSTRTAVHGSGRSIPYIIIIIVTVITPVVFFFPLFFSVLLLAAAYSAPPFFSSKLFTRMYRRYNYRTGNSVPIDVFSLTILRRAGPTADSRSSDDFLVRDTTPLPPLHGRGNPDTVFRRPTVFRVSIRNARIMLTK